MARRFPLLLASMGLLFAGAQPAQAQTIPDYPKVAVVAFQPAAAGWMVTPPQLGATIAQLMIDRLVTNGRFHVFDGRWLMTPAGPRGTASYADALAHAREAGMDYLMEGAITRLSMERRARRGGLAGIVPFMGFLRREKSELAVSLVVRLVHTRTGEVVRTAIGDGIGSRRQISGAGLGLGRRIPGGAGLSTSVSDARDAQLDEAIRRAVDAVSKVLAAPPQDGN